MNLRGKTFSRMIACTLIAGLTVPYVLPADGAVSNNEVSAADALVGSLLSAADTFVGNPSESKRCNFYNDGSKSFNMNGRTFKQGVILNENTYNEAAHVIYDVTDINKITMTFGHVDGSGIESAEISVFVDDELTDKFTLTPNAPLKDVEIDTSAGTKLRIERTGQNTKYAFGDVTVDEVKSTQTVTAPKYTSASTFMAAAFNNTRSTVYDGTNTEKYFNLNGRQYFQGVILGNGTYQKGADISFNVENVNTLSFSLCHLDNSNSEDDEVLVYYDDELQERYPLKKGELIEEVTLDVKDAKVIRFATTKAYTKYAVANLTVDELAPEKNYAVPSYKNIATLLSTVYNDYRATAYDGSSAAVSFNMNGRSYNQGIVLGDGSYQEGASVSLNVENLKSVGFTVGHVDGSERKDGEIQVFIDNELVEKIPQPFNAPLADYTFDVSNASTLTITKPGTYAQYAVANIKADALTSKNTFTIPEYKNSAVFMTSSYDAYRTTPYDGLSAATTFNMGGRKYRQGFVFGDGSYQKDAALSLNVENLKTLTFDYGHIDGSDTSEAEFEIKLDGESVEKLTLTYDMNVKSHTIDVSEAKNIRIIKTGAYSQYAIGDLVADALEPKNAKIIPEYASAEKFVESAFDDYRVEKYLGDNKFKYFTMNGTNYGQGITMGEDSYQNGARAVFNVENVGSVSFTIGSLNGENKDGTLEVYLDNGKVDTISLSGSMENTVRTYDTSEASRLMLVKTGAYSIYGVADFKIAKWNTVIPTTDPTYIIPIPTVNPSIDPTPTNLIPTAKPTATATATAVTPTAKPTATATATAVTPTAKPTATATATAVTPTAKPTATATATAVTPTAKPTATATATAVTPTAKPTATATATAVTPTAKPTATATATAVTPTAKPTSSPTPSPTPSPVTPTAVPTAAPLPDLTGDGKATTSDVRIIMKAIVDAFNLKEPQKTDADINGDGYIDSIDAVLYLKRVVAETAAAE